MWERDMTNLSGRNPGCALRSEEIDMIHVDASSVSEQVARLKLLPAFPMPTQEEIWLNAIRVMDLTTLAGDDTDAVVTRLCARARHPLSPDLAARLGVKDLHTAAVCVYPLRVAAARRALEGSPVAVASVAAGFPAGQLPLHLRLAEIAYAVDAGADEIDIVINRAHVLCGEWAALYDEICAMREACGAARLKTILSTGELGSLENVARASHVAMCAGSDWIKTSTGKEAVNATLPVSLVMCQAILAYLNKTGYRVGFKPAGGLRTAQDAVDWHSLIFDVLGADWLGPDLFRIGASSLLDELVRALSDTSGDSCLDAPVSGHDRPAGS